MSAHTPGHWEWDYSVSVKAGGQLVSLVFATPLNGGNLEHNARLIAAAPDLLQALQLVAAHIPEIIASGILSAAETDSIRAAITKAGG